MLESFRSPSPKRWHERTAHRSTLPIAIGAVLLVVGLAPFDLPIWSQGALGGLWGLLVSLLQDRR